MQKQQRPKLNGNLLSHAVRMKLNEVKCNDNAQWLIEIGITTLEVGREHNDLNTSKLGNIDGRIIYEVHNKPK